MNFTMYSLINAIKLAVESHMGQKRKYSEDDYIIHPMRVLQHVSFILRDYDIQTNLDEEEILCAAILHDTIEDTDVTREYIETYFSTNVANLVQELTKKSLGSKENRRERNRIDNEYLATVSNEAKIIKMADIFDNILDMEKCPDKGWVKKYLNEKLEQLTYIEDALPELSERIKKQIKRVI